LTPHCGIFLSLILAKGSRLLAHGSKSTWLKFWSINGLLSCYGRETSKETKRKGTCALLNESFKNFSYFLHQLGLQALPTIKKMTRLMRILDEHCQPSYLSLRAKSPHFT